LDVVAACVGAEEAICDVALAVVLAAAVLTLETGIFVPSWAGRSGVYATA
jgi:hypothetical protein